MAPKRPAPPPPPPPPEDSSEDTTSASSEEEEEEEANLAPPPPARYPAPKKPAASAAEEDSDEEEDEEETSGSESDESPPTQRPPTPAPSSQRKPPAPNRRVAPGSDSDTDEGDSDEDEPDTAPDKKKAKAAAEPDRRKAKPTAEPDRKKAKPMIEPDKKKRMGKARAEPDKKKAMPSPSADDNRSPSRRAWSLEDEVTILQSLADHRKKHGSLPRPDALAALLSGQLDNVSCNSKDLSDKIDKLKRKFDTAVRKVKSGGGLPAREHDLHLYNLSKEVWVGKARDREPLTVSNGGVKAENAAPERREYNELRKLYPNLADEVDGIEQAHPCGKTLKRALGVISDAHARALDTRIKEQRVAEAKIHMRRADLTKEVTNTLLELLNSE